MSEPITEPASLPDRAGDDLRRWLRPTRLMDLRDPKLRLRVHALTQLCKTDREKALALYGFVKRIPFAKPIKLRLRTAREVLGAAGGDAPDKATLLVAMLRQARIPARLHYYELRGEILRGLTSGMGSASRPVVEVLLDGAWVGTDTFIFDAAYIAAARDRLRASGWECGWGIHRDAQTLWNGMEAAYLGGLPPSQDPLVLQDLGWHSDPEEFVASDAFRHSRIVRAAHWNTLAPMMDRAIRELRDQGRASPTARARKTS